MYCIEKKDLIEITDEFKKKLIHLAITDNTITGIPSGFQKLDLITKGFQPSTLTIVGGVTGMGKIAFVTSLIKKLAIENKNSVAFFSLNLTSENFLVRMLNQLTNIDVQRIRLGLLNENEKERVHKKMEEIKYVPLEFYDHPFLTLNILEEALFLFRAPDSFPDIIIIDSLQLLAKNKKDKVGKILSKKEQSEIAFQLKEFAQKYKVPIIIVSEIKETIFKTRNKRPNLINVRNYAPIVTYADLILLLYRPEYYKIEDWDDEYESSAVGEGEIIIAKNACGILDTIRVKFNGAKSEFDNLL